MDASYSMVEKDPHLASTWETQRRACLDLLAKMIYFFDKINHDELQEQIPRPTSSASATSRTSSTSTITTTTTTSTFRESFYRAASLLFPVEQELLARSQLQSRKSSSTSSSQEKEEQLPEQLKTCFEEGSNFSFIWNIFREEFLQSEIVSTLRQRFGKRRTWLGDHKDLGVTVQPSDEFKEPLHCEPLLLHSLDTLMTVTKNENDRLN